MSQGLFITFEGGEGGGKSTQVRILAERLRALGPSFGYDLVQTREPGGSPGAEALRGLLLEGAADRWSPLSETLLMYAARRDHLERTILPALAAGKLVLCDRFYDSTRAYQGAAGGVDLKVIAELEAAVVGGHKPHLTLIFDLAVETGLARAAGRGAAEARFEGKGLAFHQRLRDAFLEIAAREPERCVIIDADRPPEAVAEAVWAAVAPRLK